MTDNRYQFQPWYVKLWRRRYYFLIPFLVLRFVGTRMSWGTAWSLSKGLMQSKMKWMYTTEEVRERLKRIDNKKEK